MQLRNCPALSKLAVIDEIEKGEAKSLSLFVVLFNPGVLFGVLGAGKYLACPDPALAIHHDSHARDGIFCIHNISFVSRGIPPHLCHSICIAGSIGLEHVFSSSVHAADVCRNGIRPCWGKVIVA
jgi:hypothetical protein